MLLALLAVILRRHVAAPLGDLTRAAEQVAAGDTSARLPTGCDDELGRLALAFNDMAGKVAERDAALRRDKQEIEAALTSLLYAEQQLARQRESLHQSEKLSALGGLLAGVAHELNNPLRWWWAARSSCRNAPPAPPTVRWRPRSARPPSAARAS